MRKKVDYMAKEEIEAKPKAFQKIIHGLQAKKEKG